MELSPSPLVSPILSLHADIWTNIAQILQSGDLMRLFAVGCPLLARTLALGARRFELTWSTPRFFDLDLVFTAANRLKQLRELVFTAQHPSQLFWMPVNWSLLPKTLISLELSFHCSISAFTSSHPIGSVLPSLKNLKLVHRCVKESGKREKLDFRKFPLSLLKLEIVISSAAVYDYVVEHLNYLPPQLQTLHVEGALSPRTAVQFESLPTIGPRPGGFVPLVLRLPETLQSLRLPEMGTSALNFASLPTSLTVLSGHFHESSLVDLRNMIHLKELELYGSVMIPPQDLQLYLPPSVTKLNELLGGGVETMSDDALRAYFRKVEGFSCMYTALDNLMLSGKFALPRLKVLSMYDYGDAVCQKLPPSLMEIHSLPSTSAKLPDGLKFLSVRSDPVTIDTFPPNLTALHLDEEWHWYSNFYLKLPNTLTSFSGNLSSELWLELVDFMRQPGCLPNLAEIQLYIALEAAAMSRLPNQLRKLTCTVHREKLESPLTAGILGASSLTELHVGFIAMKWTDVALICHEFPSTLQTLDFYWHLPAGHLILEKLYMPLPPHITELDFCQYSSHGHSHDVVQTFDFDLPSSLTSLYLTNTPLSLDIKLPPWLSFFRSIYDENGELVKKWKLSLESQVQQHGLITRTLSAM